MLTVTSVCRVGAALLLATTAGLGLAGCKSGGQPSSTSTSVVLTSTSLPPEPPGGYDISRISALANQFPPDFIVTPIPRTTLSQEEADKFGGFSKELSFTVDPPQCSALVKPPHIVAGTQLQGFSATGPQEISVIAAQAPGPNQPNVQTDSCAHITLSVPGKLQGTADRVPAPTIPGVLTFGIKMHFDITLPETSTTMDQYLYFAALSNRTVTDVVGKSDTDLLEGLLAKAVNALRGH